jgi:LysR family transcriptional regulator for bpeEF and oprC
MFIIPQLPSFFTQFPDVVVEFSVAQRRIDLIEDGVDVALRVGILKNSSLVARRIGSMQTITVATPDYLAAHGTPIDLDDLVSHKLIAGQTEGAALSWEFNGPDGTATLTPSGPLRSNDGEDLRAAVLANLGITHGPSALFHEDMLHGRVAQILAGYTPDAVPISAVSTSGRKMAQRTRVFVDFLAATFADEPSLRL